MTTIKMKIDSTAKLSKILMTTEMALEASGVDYYYVGSIIFILHPDRMCIRSTAARVFQRVWCVCSMLRTTYILLAVLLLCAINVKIHYFHQPTQTPPSSTGQYRSFCI